jgi:hypothetical protein
MTTDNVADGSGDRQDVRATHSAVLQQSLFGSHPASTSHSASAEGEGVDSHNSAMLLQLRSKIERQDMQIETLHDQAHAFENIRASLAHELKSESEKRLLSDKRTHHLEEEVRVLRDEMRQLKAQLQGATTVTTTNRIADVDVEGGLKVSNFTMHPSGMIIRGLEIADSPHKTPQVLPNTAPENSGDAVCSSVSSAKGGDPSPVSSTPPTPPTKAESHDMRLKHSERFQTPVASKLEYGNGSNPAVGPKLSVKSAGVVAVKHHARTNSAMHNIHEAFRETETLREEAVAQEYDPQSSSAQRQEEVAVEDQPPVVRENKSKNKNELVPTGDAVENCDELSKLKMADLQVEDGGFCCAQDGDFRAVTSDLEDMVHLYLSGNGSVKAARDEETPSTVTRFEVTSPRPITIQLERFEGRNGSIDGTTVEGVDLSRSDEESAEVDGDRASAVDQMCILS